MTEYVLLHPDGDTFTLVPALVDKPILTTVEHAPKTVRMLALERELAALRDEVDDDELGAGGFVLPVGWESAAEARAARAGLNKGVSLTIEGAHDARLPAPPDEAGRRYAGTYVGADGVARTELHHSEQRPGPQHVCECSQAFYDRAAYVSHSQSCGVHARFISDPRYEPGAFVQGGVERHPLR